jgi:DNA helicase-2/ATP-dependent DNA helicase PcrA
MTFNETEKKEREYLGQVIRMLQEAIRTVDTSVKDHVQTLQENKDYLWSNKDIDPQEVRSMRESILNHFAQGENVIARRERLYRLLDIPYFGRIDFSENKPESFTLPIYIGIQPFSDPEEKLNLIYDWRAPVSAMYYEYEPGPASYSSPSGEIEGNISLKRQYRIRKGIMEYMFESSLTVLDEILQKELSATADDKMKNIVATIQREQNRIIRNEDAPVLIIQGVAGSGKTSIALHRIAYLLYSGKGILSSRHILIISPNRVFSDYISDVLPELGEETVPGTSMEKILSEVLNNRYRYQSFFEQVSELLGKDTPGLTGRIQYKASAGFASQLDRFLLHLENNCFKASDIRLNNFFTIPAEYIREQFARFHRYPVRQRYEPMTEYILNMAGVLYRVKVSPAERNRMKEEIKNMFSGNNDLQVYRDFFEWAGKPDMFRLRKNQTIEYSDLAPMAYLHLALEGDEPRNRVKHLLIDEMQDYTPIQYKVIQKLFPCRTTILGDSGQSVNPYGSSTAEMIHQAFGSGDVMKLNKSYRSSCEITRFAQRIRTGDELEAVERHGEEPCIYFLRNKEEEISKISELLGYFKTSPYRSLGIICKTEPLAHTLYEKLKDKQPDIYFLSSRSIAFKKGIVVTSAPMAKGLEFDEVIIPHADDRNYRTELDRGMLYVAATRALHRLSLTFTGRITGLVGE